jgi:hypothetical protein
MKYLILGPQRDRIMRVVDEQPTRKGVRTLEVSNAKAATAKTLLDEGKQPIILNGEVVGLIDLHESGTDLRWDAQDGRFKIVVPEKVTPRQLKRAMIKAGLNPATITVAINSIEDATEQALAKADWEDASFIERQYPLINQFAAGFGLSEEDVDELFRAAAKE